VFAAPSLAATADGAVGTLLDRRPESEHAATVATSTIAKGNEADIRRR
jgi:hypothetical protein